MTHEYKLLDFNVYNKEAEDESDNETSVKSNNTCFTIQMFALNEQGKRASIIVEEYKPFFYLKVANNWGQTKKKAFYEHLKQKVGKYYENSITDCKLIERKKLYGFDAGKKIDLLKLDLKILTYITK